MTRAAKRIDRRSGRHEIPQQSPFGRDGENLSPPTDAQTILLTVEAELDAATGAPVGAGAAASFEPGDPDEPADVDDPDGGAAPPPAGAALPDPLAFPDAAAFPVALLCATWLI